MSLEFLEKKKQIRVRCDADGCKKVRIRGMPPSWGSVIICVPSSSARTLTLHACSTKCISLLFVKLAEDVKKFKEACKRSPKVKSKPKKAVY